jgi:transcriptional regulator with XRE-family HTH domain
MGIDQAGYDQIDGGAGLGSWQAGPTVARMLLGGRLRRLREAAGIAREDAGQEIRSSGSKISRLELGRNGFKRRDVADLLILYGVRDETERAGMLALAEQTNAPGWLHEYGDLLPGGVAASLELEQAANLIRTYATQFVPDLLQTEDYARGVMQLDADAATPRVDRLVCLLAKRQQILRQPAAPRLWAVIDEAALRRRFGTRPRQDRISLSNHRVG